MKQRLIYLLFIATLAAFAAGCNDDSPTQNSGAAGSLEITGKALIGRAGEEIGFSIFDGKVPITSLDKSKIGTDSSFTLSVPPLSRAKLKPIAEFFEYQDYEEVPQISDPNAKFQKGMVTLLYADKQIGQRLWRGSVWDSTLSSWGVYNDTYYYFDRDVEIKGKLAAPSRPSIQYNISAKAGWNIILRRYMYGELDSYTSKAKDTEGTYVWITFMLPSDSLIEVNNGINFSINE
ncbi:MAG TPA: hypothetical protein VHO28_16570 [Ignavibacteriales bacterium]|nr:hypothetical protein [Ignavibacteriales bacterium]